jgi:cytochrome c-type biogenesis protein
MENLNVFIAFIAGILSVFSPCIIPVLPGFIAYLSGLSVQHALENNSRRQILISTAIFALGFNLVFSMFGILVGSLSQFLLVNQLLLLQIGGIIVMVFGILQSGLVKLEFLQREHRLDGNVLEKNLPHYLKSFLFGIIFALSWTPCFGPVIGGIITLAATTKTFGQSLLLFVFYALGFTLPLLLLSAFISHFHNFFKSHRNFYRYSNLVAGIFLIMIGFLMFTNSLSSIVNWLNFIYTQNKLLFY